MRSGIIAACVCAIISVLPISLYAASGDEPHPADREALYEGLLPERLLCDLYNQARAALREHVEIDGVFPDDGASGRRTGEFRLKFFPQGKSRSQEHVTAEGSFRRSPDTDQQELTLRFKSSKQTPQSGSSSNQDVM